MHLLGILIIHHICQVVHVFFLHLRHHRKPTFFPYTTLFRSVVLVGLTLTFVLPRVICTRWTSVQDPPLVRDRKSTRLNSSHVKNSYAVFCLKKKITNTIEFMHFIMLFSWFGITYFIFHYLAY